MIHDLLKMSGTAKFETEVCIVGAGAAGLTVAREFLGSRTHVLVLETGGINREEQADDLNQGENVGVPDPGSLEGRARVFGGSTDLWSAVCIPLSESDFLKRPWVPFSGWPITLDDLEPYYARARTLLQVPVSAFRPGPWNLDGVGGLEYDPDLLSHCPIAFSPRPHRYFGKVLRRDFEHSANVSVLLHATATDIRTHVSGATVESLEARAILGQRAIVRARVFILCGGGFENARLLLMSRNVDITGVGNRHDLVGRFYQDHPSARIGTIYSAQSAVLQKSYGISFRGFPPRPQPFLKLRLSPELQRRQQVLNCAAEIVWTIDEASGEQAMLALFRGLRALRTPILPRAEVLKVLRDFPGTARFIGQYLRGRPSLTEPKSMWLFSMAEQEPNPSSRVTLSNQRDALGLPQVRVDRRMTELDRRTAEVMALTVRDELQRLGIARVELPEWLQGPAEDWNPHMMAPFHPTGTTRMASDPKRGVVDETCRVHGVDNLYISGSSIFPTSGYANPTLTIVALAIRLADHLRSVLK